MELSVYARIGTLRSKCKYAQNVIIRASNVFCLAQMHALNVMK